MALSRKSKTPLVASSAIIQKTHRHPFAPARSPDASNVDRSELIELRLRHLTRSQMTKAEHESGRA